MGSLGFKYIASLKGTHFTGALADNAIESESISLPDEWVTAGINKLVISELSFQAVEDLDWELIFWANGNYNSSDQDTSKIITRFSVAASTSEQIAGANQFIYENPLAQSIEYNDEDNSSKIHVSLVCRSAAGKTAGAGGYVVLRIGCTPYFS